MFIGHNITTERCPSEGDVPTTDGHGQPQKRGTYNLLLAALERSKLSKLQQGYTYQQYRQLGTNNKNNSLASANWWRGVVVETRSAMCMEPHRSGGIFFNTKIRHLRWLQK